jgi:hypothetical protein
MKRDGRAWIGRVSGSPTSPFRLSFPAAYEHLGRKREAVDALRTSYEIREVALLFLFFRPSFVTLNDDPRYQELLHEMGLRP